MTQLSATPSTHTPPRKKLMFGFRWDSPNPRAPALLQVGDATSVGNHELGRVSALTSPQATSDVDALDVSIPNPIVPDDLLMHPMGDDVPWAGPRNPYPTPTEGDSAMIHCPGHGHGDVQPSQMGPFHEVALDGASGSAYPPFNAMLPFARPQDLQLPVVPAASWPFDINIALALLESRPNPQNDHGATHFLLPFVVTDALDPLDRIIYVSDSFLTVTGYASDEVLGQNCRFLQSPDGIVVPGTARQAVSSQSAYILREKVRERRETEHSIINYKKSGEAFLNNISIVPIPWGPDPTPRFIFGFSNVYELGPSAIACRLGLDAPIPLLAGSNPLANEQILTPASLGEWPDPAPVTPYQQGDSAVVQAVEPVSTVAEVKPELNENAGPSSPPDLFSCLQGLENVDLSSLMAETPSWDRAVLENMGTLVQVLSPKGMIVFASAAHEKLGYKASDLIGKSMTDFYHPSDVAVLMREFKHPESTNLDLLLRLKQRSGQYAWFQSVGSVRTDHGRRWFTLTLIEQHVGHLTTAALSESHERSTNHGIWVKLSTSGLILHIYGDPYKPLGLSANDLIGTTFQDLLKQRDAKADFETMLGNARYGAVVSSTVILISGRGHRLETNIVLHPGPQGDRTRPHYFLTRCSILQPSARRKQKASSSSEYRSHPYGAARSVASIATHKAVPASTVGDYGLYRDDHDILGGLDADRCGPLPYEVHQLKAANRALHEELQVLLKRAAQRRRYRRDGGGPALGCANCHTKVSPEWRRGPGGVRNLCNRCGLRWAKTRRNGGGGGGARTATSSLVGSPSVAAPSSTYAASARTAGFDLGALAAGRPSPVSRLSSSPSMGAGAGASPPYALSAQAGSEGDGAGEFRGRDDIKGETE
ncbi:WC-1 [Apiospora marii]|uniref:WC-1 n=1 Tax=Apiospora marii TaxID=335849 RepID=A0ABR1RCD7_9PEZI